MTLFSLNHLLKELATVGCQGLNTRIGGDTIQSTAMASTDVWIKLYRNLPHSPWQILVLFIISTLVGPELL